MYRIQQEQTNEINSSTNAQPACSPGCLVGHRCSGVNILRLQRSRQLVVDDVDVDRYARNEDVVVRE